MNKEGVANLEKEAWQVATNHELKNEVNTYDNAYQNLKI